MEYSTPPQPAPFAKSRTTYVLLAIFFGPLGIHNFYAGYTGKAVAQLLISLLSGGCLGICVVVWSIIEACTVTRDANGVPFS